MNKGETKQTIGNNARSYIMLIALIVLWIVFSFLTEGVFITPRNLSNLTRQMATTGIIAMGITLVIITGNMDLSIGSIVGATSALVAVMVTNYNINPILTIVIAIIFGVLCAGFEGIWVAYLGVPAFIVTLGGQMIFRGVTLFITQSKSIKVNNPDVIFVGQGYVPQTLGIVLSILIVAIIIVSEIKNRKSREEYGLKVSSKSVTLGKIIIATLLIGLFIFVMYSYQGIPIALLILLIITIAVNFLLEKMKLGNHLYATGGNRQASLLSGIDTKKVTMIAFLILGFTGSISGIVLTGRLAAGTPSGGSGMELDAITSCVIGGVSLTGGKGNVWGTLVGALMMSSITNGMSLLSLPTYTQEIIKGLVLIVAVYIDVISSKKLR